MKRRSFVALFAVVNIWLTVCGQPKLKDLQQYEECVNRWLNRKPELLDRFSRDQIAWLCERSDSWQELAQMPVGQKADSHITRKQRLWLDSVRHCKGVQCLANIQRDQDLLPQETPKNRPASNENYGPKIRPRPRNSDKGLHQTKPSISTVSPPLMIPNGQNDDPKSGIFSSASTEVPKLAHKIVPLNYADYFEDLDLSSFSLANIVPKEEDFTEFDQELLVEGSSGSRCSLRRLVAYLCPRLTNEEFLETIFPQRIIQLKLGGRRTRRKLIRLLHKGHRLARICYNIEETLPQQINIQSLADCADPVFVQQQRNAISVKCTALSQGILTGEARKNKDGIGRSRKATSSSYWTFRCLQFEAYLLQYGITFESWKEELNGPIAVERSSRFPREIQQDLRVTRKEIRQMTDIERLKFQAALNKLKSETIDQRSKYDLLVIYHTPQESPGAHWGPAFLPFHRELLKQLEIALRQIDRDVFIPYWDSTLDDGLPDPTDSILWTDEFFGSGDGVVGSGPFANWSMTHELNAVPGMQTLYREVGLSPYGGLFKDTDWEFAIRRNSYSDLTACVDPTFELVHGLVHMFVGGYMADIGISPNDPVFFMHHCFIDFMWEEFRRIRQTEEQRQMQYPPNDKACSNTHHANSTMHPFPMTNIQGLSSEYTRELYTYYPRATCSDTVPSCGSKYLFCHTGEYTCISKIRQGGNCTGFQGTDICYRGRCSEHGTCIQDTTPTPPSPHSTPTPTLPHHYTTDTPSTISPDLRTPEIPTTAAVQITTITGVPVAVRTEQTTPTALPRTDLITTTMVARNAISTEPYATTTEAHTAEQTTNPTEKTLDQATTTIESPIITAHWTTASTASTEASTNEEHTATTQQKLITLAATTETSPTEKEHTTTAEPILTTATRTLATTMASTAQPPTTLPSTTTGNERINVDPISVSTTKSSVESRTSGGSESGQNSTDPSQAPFPVVWFTVTIIRGTIYYRNPVPRARVKTCGLNVPVGYTQCLKGRVLQGSVYPEYTAGALVQVVDPAKIGYFPMVKASVEVYDEEGRPCQAYCYSSSRKRYAQCGQDGGNAVTISSDDYHSDPVLFRKSQRGAMQALWKTQGYRRLRIPDYFMFKCL